MATSSFKHSIFVCGSLASVLVMACSDDTSTSGTADSLSATETGDGDGDMSGSETESDSMSGDGDGDPATGDGDGDGDGDAGMCGDGVVDMGEECDDGNASNEDACTNACVANVCGDGLLNMGVEECDDGNLEDGDGCSSTCTLDTCGDGVVDEGEACDDGNEDNTDECAACQMATCGDGYVWADNETCDDANDVETDDCLSSCELASCGDGFIQDGVEECDDGNDVDSDDCPTSCVAATCGDGFVQDGVEECDDGNNEDMDGCASDCTAECADGLLACGTCVDPNTDENNCGECDNVCADGQACIASNCLDVSVLVVGSTGIVSRLENAGYAVTSSTWANAAQNLDPELHPVAFVGRYATNWAQMSQEAQDALVAYSAAGGSIVTEWDGVSMFFSGYHDTYRYPNGALSLDWFAGEIGAGFNRGTVAVTQVEPMDILFNNVDNPFQAPGATEYFFTFYGVDEAELELLATFPGDGSQNFPQGDLPTIYRGQRCGGNIIFASFDYQDEGLAPGFGDLIPNMVEAALAPPSGNTVDVCPMP